MTTNTQTINIFADMQMYEFFSLFVPIQFSKLDSESIASVIQEHCALKQWSVICVIKQHNLNLVSWNEKSI